MTASFLRRLDRLEAVRDHRRPMLIAVLDVGQARAVLDRQRGLERLPFDPIVVITGVPRSPGDPLPAASAHSDHHP